MCVRVCVYARVLYEGVVETNEVGLSRSVQYVSAHLCGVVRSCIALD